MRSSQVDICSNQIPQYSLTKEKKKFFSSIQFRI